MLHINEQSELLQVIRKEEQAKNYPELCLTWDEIWYLDNDPLITIGVHTHSHPNLRKLSIKDAREEIYYSKKLLEKNLGHPVIDFAYPYGTLNEANVREYDLSEKCEFKTAVTTLCYPMKKRNNLFCFPRYKITE